MAIVAGFHWSKSPHASLSTLVYDSDTMQILSPPKIALFSKSFFFKMNAKKFIKDFFSELASIHVQQKKFIRLEFKIVFPNSNIPFLKPSKQSEFIYKTFIKFSKKYLKLNIITLATQLRKKLSGTPLKRFKRELRYLSLVSRKKNTNYEYHLWCIVLHATAKNYENRLKALKSKLINSFWNNSI